MYREREYFNNSNGNSSNIVIMLVIVVSRMGPIDWKPLRYVWLTKNYHETHTFNKLINKHINAYKQMIPIYIYMYRERDTYVYIYIYVYYVYIYIYIHTRTHVCIYIYIYNGPQFTGARVKHRGVRFRRTRDFRQYMFRQYSANFPIIAATHFRATLFHILIMYDYM